MNSWLNSSLSSASDKVLQQRGTGSFPATSPTTIFLTPHFLSPQFWKCRDEQQQVDETKPCLLRWHLVPGPTWAFWQKPEKTEQSELAKLRNSRIQQGPISDLPFSFTSTKSIFTPTNTGSPVPGHRFQQSAEAFFSDPKPSQTTLSVGDEFCQAWQNSAKLEDFPRQSFPARLALPETLVAGSPLRSRQPCGVVEEVWMRNAATEEVLLAPKGAQTTEELARVEYLMVKFKGKTVSEKVSDL